MRRFGRTFLYIVLALLLVSSGLAALWLGLVPQRYSPLAPISLDQRPEWFVGFRLAALRRDKDQCRALLASPHLTATPIPDEPIRHGCGWSNAVTMSSAGGAEVGAARITCEMAAALALWITYEVQPRALSAFGARVVSVGDMGTYACRNILGSKTFANMRSQHALANAVDIADFRLENGKVISVARNWKSRDREARFLHEVHERACGYFRVALGPDYNSAHHDHFHFDRGVFTRCK
jgi:hypothetical protein